MGIKVVHIVEAWVGGISTYVTTLINHQLESEKFDEISLIYSENKIKTPIEKEFPNHPKLKFYNYQSSRNPLKFLKIAGKINNIISEIKPDIIHLHSTFAGVYGRLVKKNCPIIYCPHCWSFAQDIGIFKKYIYALVEKILIKRTDAVINISRNEYDASKKFKVKAQLNPIIFNGLEDAKNIAIKPNIKIDQNLINIGFIGRLDYQKGFDIIEPYFRNLKLDNVKLYVIGSADRNKDKAYPQSSKIEYLGWIDNQNLDSYIKLFDIIIIPSRYEGFGLIAIEAMRNHKPVIISSGGALSELVINGFNGYIFDLDDAFLQLDEILLKINKQDLVKMGENGRKVYLSNFTADRFTSEIENLYLKLL